MNELFDKYILILRITRDIVVHPFAFGSTFQDSVDETKRAARYMFEGVIFAVAIFQLSIPRMETEMALLDLPFAGEIIGGVMVISVLLTGLTTHPMARLFSDSDTTWHGRFASFLYWTGFCLLVLPALFVILAIAWQWLFQLIDVSSTAKTLILFAIMAPVLIIYYMGTIVSWISRQYKLTAFMAVLAILFGYSLSMVLSGAAFAAYTSIVNSGLFSAA